MSPSSFPLPRGTRIPDSGRQLDLAQQLWVDPEQPAEDGAVMLARLDADAAPATLNLAEGRAATLFPGDLVVVVTARYRAPLAVSCDLPLCGMGAALVCPDGIAGQPLPDSLRVPSLSLLGRVVDSSDRAVRPATLKLASGSQRPVLTLCVLSVARGARAAALTHALLRGFVSLGTRVGAARPFGMLNASERWRQLDAGAVAAFDPVDLQRWCTDGVPPSLLWHDCDEQLAELAALNCDVGLLRLPGGMASNAIYQMLNAPPPTLPFDGLIIAAADAMAAVEACHRLANLSAPVIAIGGAISQSPLAMREATLATGLPVLSNNALAQTSELQRLVSEGLQAPSSIPRAPLALAA